MANKEAKEVDKVKKESSGGLLIVVVLLFLILLLVMAGLGYYYNFGGIKDKIVTYFTTQSDVYIQKLAELDASIAALDVEKKGIEEANAQIVLAKAASEQTKNRLASDAEKLKVREENVSKRESAVSDKQKQLATMTSTISNMNAASAAKMLEEMGDVKTVASILSGMESKKSAAILSSLDAKKAAEVAAAMLN